jgi:hypothetical protein
MISLAGILIGSLFVAIGLISWIGPARFLAGIVAGIVAVPIMWALVSVSAVAVWIAVRLHGASP